MAVVDTTNSFVNNEQITSVKLNNIMDNSFFVSNAVVPSRGLEVTAGGQLQVPNSGITTALIADANIIPAKLSNSDFGDFTVSGGVATIDNGIITPVKLSQPLTSGTAVTASGSSVNFTGIPNWAKIIHVVFDEISTNGTSIIEVRLGTSSGIEASNYIASFGMLNAGSASNSNSSTGFPIQGQDAGSGRIGTIVFLNLTNNTWVGMGTCRRTTTDSAISFISGSKSLSGALTQISITTVGGVNTFDAGTVNVIYQ